VLVGRGVGVDRGAAVGASVGFGDGLGVGAVVGWGVGRGLAVRPGVGAADAVGVGPPGVTGAVLGPGVASGTTAMPVGLAAGEAGGDVDGNAAVVGEGDGVTGGALGTVDGGDVAGPAGVWVGTTATGADGAAEGIDRSRNSTPPIPRAIVARTRFRTPRLRMSRAR
jgi:hypothetical protein